MQIVLEHAFEAIVGAMVRAAKEFSFSVAFTEAERNGLIEQGDGKPSQLHVWERSMAVGLCFATLSGCTGLAFGPVAHVRSTMNP